MMIKAKWRTIMKLDFDYIYDVLKKNISGEGDVWTLSKYICRDEIYLNLWKKCGNYDEFYKCVMNQEESDSLYVNLYLYGKIDADPREKIHDLFVDRCFDIKSDDGDIFAGNDSCQTFISNDLGGGTTKVAVFNLDDPNRDLVRSAMGELNGSYNRTRLIGKINIYPIEDMDTLKVGEPCITLEGEYHAYSYRGLVAFVEYEIFY